MPETARFRHGAGRLSLDFVRTLRHRGRPEAEEELPDAEALSAWVGEFGPVATGPEGVALVEVEGVHGLREAVYQLVEAARGSAGAPTCPADAREVINRAAALPVPAPLLDADGDVRWRADEPVAATLSLIARDALDLVSSGAVDRVRNCADPTCRALFYDGSRPGSRRWCSMGACGNRAKKATLRAKS
jgi:predicted RNA-binding Zn ribbon-like protein